MKKTIMTLLVGLCCSLGISAQNANTTPFEQNKIYLGASVTGLGFSYNQTEKWNGALQFKGGYLFEDNWMVTGQLGYDYHQNASNAFTAGIGLRYYLEDFGVYVGAGANYKHAFKTYDDFMPTINVGYAFFLNHFVTLEPEIYYEQSLKNHKDYSGFGIRLGIGIYLD